MLDLATAGGNTPAARLNELLCAQLVRRWQERYSRGYAYDLRHWLRRFLVWLERTGGPKGLWDQLPRLRKPEPRTVIAQPGELREMLRRSEPWLRLFLYLTGQRGLRFTEAAELAPIHYDAERQEITFPKKGGGTLTLPVSEQIANLLQLAPTTTDPTMPFLDLLRGKRALRGERMAPSAIRRAWKKLKRDCGVNPELRPHDLRRTFAVELYEGTKDIRAVQQAMGHKHLASTVHYLAHRDPARLRALLESLRLPTEVKQ